MAAEQLLAHGFVEQARRHVLDPHAPFLEHDLPLGRQLLLDDAQVGHAVGLHAHHHLEPVGGDGLVITGDVEVGEGVLATAVARDDAREFTGPERGCALEHHVLEEVRDAGAAEDLVGTAHLVDQHLGDDRCAARRQHDHLQSVAQDKGLGRPARDSE